MGNQILLFLSLLALFFLQSNTSASKAAGFEASSEFSYDPCSPLGPQNWGTLHPSWANCTASPEGMQSPISIKPSNIHNRHLSRLDTYYTDAPARLLNYEGHEIRVSWTQPPGHLRLHDKLFYLRQCHWHAPSEHELFGKRYPLELHMVHTTSDSPSEIAVIGVLFEYGGTPDPFLDKLWEALKKLNDVVTSVDVGSIYPPRVGDEGSYFRYNGSLTTPPCSEPVIWTVMKKVRSVWEDQVNRLRGILDDMDNARPTQAINGREVYFSHPHPYGEQKEEGHASS